MNEKLDGIVGREISINIVFEVLNFTKQWDPHLDEFSRSKLIEQEPSIWECERMRGDKRNILFTGG